MPHEEPEEGTDQLTFYREKCTEELPNVPKLKDLLEECNERVTSRKYTEETCEQELIDLVNAIDKCAQPKAFAKLK